MEKIVLLKQPEIIFSKPISSLMEKNSKKARGKESQASISQLVRSPIEATHRPPSFSLVEKLSFDYVSFTVPVYNLGDLSRRTLVASAMHLCLQAQ